MDVSKSLTPGKIGSDAGSRALAPEIHRSATTYVLVAGAIFALIAWIGAVGAAPAVVESRVRRPAAQDAAPAPITRFYPQPGGLSPDSPPPDRQGPSYVAFSADGSTLAAGTPYGVGLYDAQDTGDVGFVRFIDTAGPVISLAYSPDGSLLATGSFTGTIQLWDLLSGTAVRSLNAPQGAVNDLAFDPAGAMLASANADGGIRLWRVSDGRLARVLRGHLGSASSVAFSPDGSLVASGGADGAVRLWRTANGVPVSTLVGNIGGVPAIAFDPGGTIIGLGAGDGAVRLWRIEGGELPVDLSGHRAAVTALDFTADGANCVTASYDGTVVLQRLGDAGGSTTLQGPTGAIGSLALGPGGVILATGALDGAVHIWGLETAITAALQAPVVVVIPTTRAARTPLIVPTRDATPALPAASTEAAPTCADSAAFVADVTIPDSTVVPAGSRIDKTWRVRNGGVCPWSTGYELRFVSGDPMGSAGVQSIIAAAPGANFDVSVTMYAPAAPGMHTGAWRLVNAAGQFFGPTLSVVIQVPPTAVPTWPAPPPPPPPPPQPTDAPPAPAAPFLDLTVDPTHVDAGERVTVRASVENVQAAWLDGEAIVNNFKEVIDHPCSDRTFVLEAQLSDGRRMRRTATVAVRGECDSAPIEVAEADLIVTDFSYSPRPAKIGRAVQFVVKIKNKGVGPAQHFDLMIMQEQLRVFATVDGDISLNEGREKTFTWGFMWPALAGSVQFSAWVDSQKVITEIEEQNNIRTIDVLGMP